MIQSIENLELKGKKVFMRVEFSVPIQDGVIQDDTRIVSSLKTIKYAMDKGAKVIIASHFGRPKGEKNPKFSLRPVAEYINSKSDEFFKVSFLPDCIGAETLKSINNLSDGEAVLLENLRFYPGEEKNDSDFVNALSELCDVYVSDAFGTCHRKHASTYGLPGLKSEKAAGFLVLKEAKFFDKIIQNPQRPFAAIVGGAKVSDKLGVIKSLLEKADKIFIGGAMAYTFLKQQGYSIGTSLVEEDLLGTCEQLLKLAKEKNVKIFLPTDHIASDKFGGEPIEIHNINLPENMMGLDIGYESIEIYKQNLKDCKTVLWNGPMGVFENDDYNKGTFAIAETVASMDSADTIIGGGDSVSAVNKAGLASKMSHISTGGGASLEYIEHGTLPGIDKLRI